MERRDLIKDQIEQLGRVIGKIISGFLGFKSQGEVDLGIEIANKNFKTALDIDIEYLLSLSKIELRVYLLKRKLTSDHIEKLVDYFAYMGEFSTQADAVKKKIILQKALVLNEIAEDISRTLSFERIDKIRNIKNLLRLIALSQDK